MTALLHRTDRVPLLAAGVAALAWLPFVARPATPDEGGYLLVASNWHLGSGGTSLYGDYWVDRPPLLLTIYRLAQALGGTPALRLLGVVAVVVSVLLAARLAAAIGAPPDAPAAPDTRGGSGAAPSYAAVVTAALMTTPLFGGLNVNGELFAAPFLLAGLLALVRAVQDDAGRWWLLAGAAGAAAAMIKQSQVDLVVVGLVVVVLRVRTHGARAALGAAGRLLAGGLAVTVALLGWAWLHGTDPGGLWEAVVAFRFDAASVIGTSSGGVTERRAGGLLGAFLASGAPVLVVLLALSWRRRRPTAPGHAPGLDPRLLGTVLLAWELVGVALGGSYWLHYLVGLVPGLAVATACLTQRAVRVTAALVATSAVVSVVVFVAVGGRAPEDGIATYLRSHRRPGDTVTVAFGRPHIVYESGMSSPYDELWSLPVRVRDRHLTDFGRVLAGPDRPDWLVVAGSGLRTWGITDIAAADRLVAAHYVEVHRFPGYRVLHIR